MVSNMDQYFSENRDRHLQELKDYLRIPSISTLAANKEDVHKAAQWTADALVRAGLENVEVMATNGHPVVYGDWLHAPGKPTALIYGHYDVQPVDPLHLWTTPPFEPDIRDEKIYARGATDDKGSVFMHIKAIEALLQTKGTLPVNIKFCIEGEEEIGSPSLAPFLIEHKEKLKADVVVISDGPMFDKGQPSICYGLRGALAFDIFVKGPNSDLHSGMYGGGVQNPVHALVEILSSMHDSDGRITIDGFYDKVPDLTDAERKAYQDLPFDEERVKQELGISALFGENGYSYLEQTSARPTLEICGIGGGFQGEGFKAIVPSQAEAKIACRLVGNQNPDEVMDLIEAHIERVKPVGVEVSVNRVLKGDPFFVSIDHPYMVAAASAYEQGYGKRPLYTRSGGSIPIVGVFSKQLEAPVVLMGFGLPDEKFHAPNEHFHLENFDKGLRTICYYWEVLGNLEK